MSTYELMQKAKGTVSGLGWAEDLCLRFLCQEFDALRAEVAALKNGGDAANAETEVSTANSRREVGRSVSELGLDVAPPPVGKAGGDDRLLKIATLFNGWANAGPSDGGPCSGWTAQKVLSQIGEVLGDPFASETRTPSPLDYECPSEHCPMCSNEACNLCGAGCWDSAPRPSPGRPICEHDVTDRHREPNSDKATVEVKEEEFRAGLPAEVLRQACVIWEEREIGECIFSETAVRWCKEGRTDLLAELCEKLYEFRPHGMTWTKVERMAAEKLGVRA